MTEFENKLIESLEKIAKSLDNINTTLSNPLGVEVYDVVNVQCSGQIQTN